MTRTALYTRLAFHPMTLGRNVAAMRKELGLTLDALSLRSGVETGVIHALEARGSTKSKHAPALAAALGVTLDQLLGAQTPTPGASAQSARRMAGVEEALSVLGRELSRSLAPEVRSDLADALRKLAERGGQRRDQQLVLALLSEAEEVPIPDRPDPSTFSPPTAPAPATPSASTARGPAGHPARSALQRDSRATVDDSDHPQ